MGLDITAHAYVDFSRRWVAPPDSSEYEEPEDPRDWVFAYVNPDFTGRAEGIETGYYWTGRSQSFSFRAGSYSGYNVWRSELKAQAKSLWTPVEQLAQGKRYPFYELINFSDCEGVIGPKTCAVLNRDFDALRRAWRGDQHDNWASAFRLAANTGCVCFH